MGGAAPRPSTRTMVLCTGTRGSRVRCAPRQRRPGRAARAAGRRTRSLPDSLHDSLHVKQNQNSGVVSVKTPLSSQGCDSSDRARTGPRLRQQWPRMELWGTSLHGCLRHLVRACGDSFACMCVVGWLTRPAAGAQATCPPPACRRWTVVTCSRAIYSTVALLQVRACRVVRARARGTGAGVPRCARTGAPCLSRVCEPAV